MHRTRKILLIAAGLTVFATASAALVYSGLRRGAAEDTSPAAELLSEVPPGAPTLIFLDLAAVRASSFYQHRTDKSPIAVPDTDYANFIAATGFDFEKDLDQVVIASWPQSLVQDRKKTIVFAEGRFDRQKIHDYAMKKGKLVQEQGREVFVFPTGVATTGPGRGAANDASRNPRAEVTESTSLVFLSDHRIALVEGSSIAPLLATRDVSGVDPVRVRAAGVAGAAAFLISRVPAIPDNFAPGGVQSAQLASLVRSVQWITLAARPEGDNVRISLEGECANPTDARQLQAALQMARMFGQAALESPKTRQSMDAATFGVLETLLKSADVTQAAERVRILVEVTPDILKLSGPAKAQKSTGN